MFEHQSVAFISDIHGNLTALNAVLKEIAVQGVERIVCLGDIVDLGPQPQGCVERLRGLEIPCIRGNHDPLDEASGPLLLEVQQWTMAQLSQDARSWLGDLPASIPVEVGGLRVLGVHGSTQSASEGLHAEMTGSELDVVLSLAGTCHVIAAGHTHVQLLRRTATQTIMNVGSVGMPFREAYNDKPPKIQKWAEYGIIRASNVGNASFELHRANYSFDDFSESFDPSFPSRDRWIRQWVN